MLTWLERMKRKASTSPWFTLAYLFDWSLLVILWFVNLSILLALHPPKWPFVRPLIADPNTIITNVRKPMHNFYDNRYDFPGETDTIPVWFSGLHALSPVVVFALSFWKTRSLHDLHHSILGLLTAITLLYLTILPIQHGMGKWRPDFDWRLEQPHGKARAGRLSFPSGHSALAFTSMVYFGCWASAKLRAFHTRHGEFWKIAICMLCPVGTAVAISVTRISDYRHHPVDVLGGALIGVVIGIWAYNVYYPPLVSECSHIPKTAKQKLSIANGGATTSSDDFDLPSTPMLKTRKMED